MSAEAAFQADEFPSLFGFTPRPQIRVGLEMSAGLAGLRIIDFSEEIAGPYCSKLFVDAGAEVIKVESQQGDSLRRRSAVSGAAADQDSALFVYLNAGKRSVIGEASDPEVQALLANADLVVQAKGLESDTGRWLDVAALRAAHPSLVVLSITPYGLEGPWADRRATEFTLQAESGSIGMRGVMGKQPFQAGGRICEWAGGTFGAVASLPAIFRARATGEGEAIDLSLLETANLIFTNYSESMNRLMNGSPEDPENSFLAQSVETPSIERTADGYVGFCTNSRQQFSDFLRLIDREDLQSDDQLAQFAGRLMRFDEWNGIISAWLTEQSTDDVIEAASLLRIPVSPICNGETVLRHEQLAERKVFGPSAEGGFIQPRPSYRIDDRDPPDPLPAPGLGEQTDTASFSGGEKEARGKVSFPWPATSTLVESDPLPFAGLRVLDMTAWWAGPSASHILATFGAEVIHIESTGHPDGMRMVGGMMAAHYDEWWEASSHFLHANSNKLGITLDLGHPTGRELVEKLIEKSDAIVENYTPRVLENFGINWDRVQELNPNALMMRMPAFGLSGPWRDNTGFAQTMEQLSGMAWLTGHRDDQPRIPRGPCDPLAGMHATFAFLVALCQREGSGHGHHVESTMVESALNIAAEQVVEWTAYGHLLERDGNRSSLAAPQGLYPCAGGEPGMEKWLALSVASDEQWRALRSKLGEPEWSVDSKLETMQGRRAAHDRIDQHLSRWTRQHERAELVAELRALGLSASELADPSRVLQGNPQFRARGYFERPAHSVVGSMPLPSLPFRFASVERWLRTPAPTMGQHNEEVLGGILGLSPEELRELADSGVIGTRPEGF